MGRGSFAYVRTSLPCRRRLGDLNADVLVLRDGADHDRGVAVTCAARGTEVKR